MLKKLLLTVCIIATIAYPCIIYAGLKFELLQYVLPILVVVFALRFILSLKGKSQLKYFTLLSLLVACILCTCSFLFKRLELVLYYPVLVNTLFFAVFFRSLFEKQSIITRFAQLTFKGQALPAYVETYTRNVTKVWCVFCVLNGVIALVTIFLGIEIWTLYNGLISYILMGLLMAIEYATRVYVRHRHEH